MPGRVAYACDNQLINLNVTELSLKMGPLRAGPLFGELSAKRLSKSRAKGGLLLGWSGALGTSGFLS